MTHFRAYKNVSECLAKANVVGEGGTEMVKNGRFGYLPCVCGGHGFWDIAVKSVLAFSLARLKI